MYPAQATQAEYELMLFYFLANVSSFFLLNCIYLVNLGLANLVASVRAPFKFIFLHLILCYGFIFDITFAIPRFSNINLKNQVLSKF